MDWCQMRVVRRGWSFALAPSWEGSGSVANAESFFRFPVQQLLWTNIMFVFDIEVCFDEATIHKRLFKGSLLYILVA